MYTVSLRNPYGKPDFQLTVERSASVGQLKRLISEQYPSKPPVEHQKLIFAGRLLADSAEPLERVFSGFESSSPLSVHLIVSAATAPASTPAPAPAPVNLPPPAWQQYPGNYRFGQAAPPPQVQLPLQQQAAAAGGPSLSLLFKLAVMVVIVSQGGS